VIFTALLVFFAAGLPGLRAAGSSKWTSIGPFGGSIQSLAIDPQNPTTLYAGTNSGIFKSTDGGTSWISINSMFFVGSLAIDPQNSDTLYAGGYGVFKSVDGGINWSEASSGIFPMSQNGPGYGNVLSLVIDPQHPDTLYAGTARGLYKSVDGSATWKAAGAGLPTLPVAPGVSVALNVDRLTIDPQNPNTLYTLVSLPHAFGNGGLVCCSTAIFKTTDGGASWNALAPPVGRLPSFDMPSPISTIAIDPQNPKTVYAVEPRAPALFKSVDGGATWSTVNSGIAPFALAIDPQNPNTLYASTNDGFFKSADGGTNWTAAASGLPGGVGLVAIDPQHPTIVYAARGMNGLFKSVDGAANWTSMNSGMSTWSIRALAIDPHNSSSIYAAVPFWQGGVLKTEGGSKWTSLSSTLPNFYPVVLAIDPQNPKTLYAGTYAGDFGPAGGIFKSTDGGVTWSAATSGLPEVLREVSALAIDPKSPNTILAGTDQGVFKSIDAGASWNKSNIGLPDTYISALTIDPQTPRTVYASGSGRLFKSLDGGVRWGALDFPANVEAGVLAIDPQNSNVVYAGSYKGLFKSTDAGASWTASGMGLPTGPWMSALVIDPQNPSTLYTGFSGAELDSCNFPCSGFNDGVFKSIDAGATWTAVNSGLTTQHVTSLAIDPQNPDRLYAGTLGGGVFAINFGPAPVVTDLRFDRTSVVAGGSYSVTASGSNLTPQTFFDVRFSAPGSSTSYVVLNWQKGIVASHGVSADIPAGTWTITGVRAHEFDADHGDSFVPVSAAITVN